MSEGTRHACRRCTRTDLALTANGKIRSHAANGKRASAENPHCPGGSDWPKHDHDFQKEGDGVFRCQVCEKEDPRPSGQEVRNAQAAINYPAAPDEIYEAAEALLRLAGDVGVRPCAPEDHTFKNEYDDHGQFESLCSLCGAEDDRPTKSEVMGSMADAMSAPPEAEDAALAVAADAARRGVRPVALSADTATGGPNPHRSPLSTGSAAQDQARAIPSGGTISANGTSPSADDLLDGEAPEEDDAPRYFPARYDGDCATCGRDFAEGDMIRKAPDDGWEAEACCGAGIDEEAGQRPQSTAPQLPVRNGRYEGPHPDTGKTTRWTRSTRFAEGVADQLMLTLWQLRMAGMGLSLRPDLLRKISNILTSHEGTAYEIAKSQREVLNAIMEDAKLAAGSKDRARKGTILHKHTQEIDMGRKSLGDVPKEFRTSVNAYLIAMADSGLTCIPDLIERSTMSPSLKVAGTFDRVLHVTKDLAPVTFKDGRTVQLHEGDFVIGDVKSGQDLSYAWAEILIQLAIYANGVAETGVAVPDRLPSGKVVWRWADLAEFGIDRFRTDVGIVMHMPYGETTCDLHYADLVTGWRGAKISQTVHEYRKTEMPSSPIASYAVSDQTFKPAGGRAAPKVGIDPSGPSGGEAIAVAQTVDGNGKVTAQREMIPGGVPLAIDPGKLPETPRKPRRTWEDVAAAVQTPDEANKVWSEMRKNAATVGMDRINKVTAIMREALRKQGALRS
jgi:hypothetical protein